MCTKQIQVTKQINYESCYFSYYANVLLSNISLVSSNLINNISVNNNHVVLTITKITNYITYYKSYLYMTLILIFWSLIKCYLRLWVREEGSFSMLSLEGYFLKSYNADVI